MMCCMDGLIVSTRQAPFLWPRWVEDYRNKTSMACGWRDFYASMFAEYVKWPWECELGHAWTIGGTRNMQMNPRLLSMDRKALGICSPGVWSTSRSILQQFATCCLGQASGLPSSSSALLGFNEPNFPNQRLGRNHQRLSFQCVLACNFHR